MAGSTRLSRASRPRRRTVVQEAPPLLMDREGPFRAATAMYFCSSRSNIKEGVGVDLLTCKCKSHPRRRLRWKLACPSDNASLRAGQRNLLQGRKHECKKGSSAMGSTRMPDTGHRGKASDHPPPPPKKKPWKCRRQQESSRHARNSKSK